MALQYRTLFLILVISLPILATVITAFRVRDLPKVPYEKFRTDRRETCDDCDGVSDVNKLQKLHNVKGESGHRSVEEMKKAVHEKQQILNQNKAETKPISKPIFSVSDDDDDDDDEDDDDFDSRPLISKQSQTKRTSSSKEVKGSFEIRTESKKKKTLVQLKDDDDDDDDDDDVDDDDDDDQPKSVKKTQPKSTSNSKLLPNEKITPKKKVSKPDNDDDDDDVDKKKTKQKAIDQAKNVQSKPNPTKDQHAKKVIDAPKSEKKEALAQKAAPKIIFEQSKHDFDDDDDDDDNDEKVKKSKVKTESKQADAPKIENKQDHHEDKSKKMVQNNPVKSQKPDTSPKIAESKTKPEAMKQKDLVETKKNVKVEDDDKDEDDYVKSKKSRESSKEKSKSVHSEIKIDQKKSDSAKKDGKHDDKSSKESSNTKIVDKKPQSKESKDSSEKRDHKKDHIKKTDSSAEMLVDSEEIEKRSESYMKTVNDALLRRNLLSSEFEGFYAFFPTFAPNFSRIHNPECRRHGQILLRQLRGTKLWALNMLDATAKIPSGLLQGNGIQLGDFDQCLGSRARVQLDSGSVVKVQGQYCLVLVDVKAEHPELEVPVHLAQARNVIKSRIDDPGHFVPRFSTLSWGVCVPSACEPEDVEIALKDALKHYQHTSGLTIRVKVDEDDCHTDDGDEWWEDWMVPPTLMTLSLYGVVVFLVILATALDYFRRRETSEDKEDKTSEEADDQAECDQNGKEEEEVKEEAEERKSSGGFVSNFSLYSSVGKLVAPASTDDISCVHGVRALATMALLVAHKFLAVVANTPYSNRLKATEEASSMLWSWSRSGWQYTDCFLLLSGTLLAHRIAADADTGAPKRLLSRYLRLTPALLAVVLFYAFVWDNLSTGPRWGSLITKNAEICQEGWWWNLLYVQNYFGFEEMCAPQTHQLALDMQLTVLGSILVWGQQVKPAMIKILIPGMIASAAYARYTATIEHRLTMIVYHGVSISQLYRTAKMSYTSSFHRSTPYLIGLCLGMTLQKPTRHNKLVLILGWLGSVALWCLVLWSGLDAGYPTYRYSAAEAAQYAALAPIASALAVAWVIYAVHTGHSESLSGFLCSRPLALISRLSYALYLIQFIVFYTKAATIRSSTEFTMMSLIDLQEISAVFISAVVLTLTFIIPMQSLHKYISFSSKSHLQEETENEPETETQETEIEENGKVQQTQEEKDEEEAEEIIVPQTRSRQHLVAHHEVLEEIPEAEVEYEIQREKDEGLEEILEEEEDEEPEEIEAEDIDEQNPLEDDELEVIEEEQGGEDDFWADRQPDYVPRRHSQTHTMYTNDNDQDNEEWEWTSNGQRNTNTSEQYYRYGR